jgi:hypothetical protein
MRLVTYKFSGIGNKAFGDLIFHDIYPKLMWTKEKSQRTVSIIPQPRNPQIIAKMMKPPVQLPPP